MTAEQDALQLLLDALLKGDLGELLSKVARAQIEKSSIEIGTPGKAGHVKVYVDAHDLEGAKILINNMMDARVHAIMRYEGTN